MFLGACRGGEGKGLREAIVCSLVRKFSTFSTYQGSNPTELIRVISSFPGFCT